MKLVITMSRRFGTGASVIANELSKRLDIPVYDKAYIEQKLGEHEYETEADAIRKLAEKPFKHLCLRCKRGSYPSNHETRESFL